MVFITLGPASEYKFMFLLDLEIIIFASNLLRRAHLIQYSYSAIILLGNIVELKSKYEELQIDTLSSKNILSQKKGFFRFPERGRRVIKRTTTSRRSTSTSGPGTASGSACPTSTGGRCRSSASSTRSAQNISILAQKIFGQH